MANQQKIDYLNKIAKDNRGAKAGALDGFELNPKLLIKILVGFGIFMVVMIAIGAISSMTNRDTTRSRDLVDQISARAENLETTLEKYQDKVRDSELRAAVLNLETFLNMMRANVEVVVTSGNYGAANEGIIVSEQAYIEELDATLEEARLNAALDETMGREMKKEVQLLMAMEKECMGRSDDERLKEVLAGSYEELSGIVAEL